MRFIIALLVKINYTINSNEGIFTLKGLLVALAFIPFAHCTYL